MVRQEILRRTRRLRLAVQNDISYLTQVATLCVLLIPHPDFDGFSSGRLPPLPLGEGRVFSEKSRKSVSGWQLELI